MGIEIAHALASALGRRLSELVRKAECNGGGASASPCHGQLRDSFLVECPPLDICCKRVVFHKAHTEDDALAVCKRPSHDYVSASHRVFAAVLAADNADSSLRIESLYDSQHVDPAALGTVRSSD